MRQKKLAQNLPGKNEIRKIDIIFNLTRDSHLYQQPFLVAHLLTQRGGTSPSFWPRL